MTADVHPARQGSAPSRLLRFSRVFRRPPLLFHLCAFALVVLVPALLFSAILILQFSRQQDELALARVNDSAQTVSASIDRELVGLITTAQVLSASIDLNDLEAFHERATAALAETGADAAVVDRQFRVLLNTRTSFSPVPRQASSRDWIEAAFATGKPQISGLLYSPTLRRFAVQVAVPIMRDGVVQDVMLIYKRADQLRGGLDDEALPRAWSIVIRDRTGKRINASMASHEPGAADAVETKAFDQPSILEAVGLPRPGDMIEASHVSRVSGWTTTVAVPQAVVDQPVIRSWFWLAVAGSLLFLFCFSMTLYVGRRLATPILALAHQARAIGRGEPAARITTRIGEISEVSKVLAHASRERRESEEQNRFLMREMVHRAKNQYALIAAIARRAAKESATTSEFQTTLSEALNSLARSSDLLAASGWEGAGLQALAESQLSAFGAGRSSRIRIQGPPIRLNASAAQTIGLALHELATNAAKYGSLSVEDGSIDIGWTLEAATFGLFWRERDGPPVVPPKRSGFGSLVVQKMTSRGLGGSVDMRFEESGVVWTLTAPAESVILPP